LSIDFSEYIKDADKAAIRLFEETGHQIAYHDDQYITEMATIGRFGRHENEDDNNAIICIYAEVKGASIPHFHFYKSGIVTNTGGGCLTMKEERYFNHGTHTETLNSKEAKYLMKYLKSKPNGMDITVWHFMIYSWNANNPNSKIDINTPIPDYDKGIDPYK